MDEQGDNTKVKQTCLNIVFILWVYSPSASLITGPENKDSGRHKTFNSIHVVNSNCP